MTDEPLMPRATFRLLRETPDLRVAEAIRNALGAAGIAAVIVNDEAVQGLPDSERHARADGLNVYFRVEVPAELHAAAARVLRDLERREEP
jgi:hypothetical protein